MVLAAMLKESVIKKAREEGRREAREECLKRWHEAFDRFGVEVDGVLMLPADAGGEAVPGLARLSVRDTRPIPV